MQCCYNSHDDEKQRLKELYEYQVLDSGEEILLDELTELASNICYGFMQMQGGDLRLDQSYNEGAAVDRLLPKAAPAAGKTAQ